MIFHRPGSDLQAFAAPKDFVLDRGYTWKGFIVTDFAEQRPEFERELTGYLRAGTLKNHETVVTGIEQAVPAFLGLFEGKNTGKC